MNGKSLERNPHQKRIWKNLKKYLTNSKRCDNIKQFAADARATAKSELPVPCKLNNVKTNYNTLDNYELFKISCKRILSQRKFLSNIARSKLFKKWFEQPEGCLDTIFWEFDPGSGRTLAACLTHASRTEVLLRWYFSGERVSNAWETCLSVGDNSWKRLLIPHNVIWGHPRITKA